MLIRRPDDIPTREITDESLYLSRRSWLTMAGVAAVGLLPASLSACGGERASAAPGAAAGAATGGGGDEITPYDKASTYNNFYEFGTGKGDPSRNAHTLQPRPWTVMVDGDVRKPGRHDLTALLAGIGTVDRTYRHRCVEGWSMVIPWNGIPLADLIRKVEPGTKAKYVEFTTLYDTKQMPLQRSRTIDWPYVEGLRMDEAMNPLVLLATGMYGKTMPNQNGAPVRLVVPWKYGFKGGKSIVRIRFVEEQPLNTWQQLIPGEYGFYANVNPAVDHPRWSQARERRIGDFLKIPTLPFNGYAAQVASLYAGMDLRKNF